MEQDSQELSKDNPQKEPVDGGKTEGPENKSFWGKYFVLILIFGLIFGYYALVYGLMFLSSRVDSKYDSVPIPEIAEKAPVVTEPVKTYPVPEACTPVGIVSAPMLPVSTTSPGLKKNSKPKYYDINGWLAQDLNQQIDQCGYKDDEGVWAGAASSYFSWDYEYDIASNGTCKAKDIAVGVQVVIAYPRWNQPADAPTSTIEWWQEYMRTLEIHENGHRDINFAAGQEIIDNIAALTYQSDCYVLHDKVKSITNAAIANSSAENKRYDKITGHGKTQSAWDE